MNVWFKVSLLLLVAGLASTFSSGASAQTPTSVAITGWRQKPVTDLQSIGGKWEGFGLTAKGKKFDLEITFRDDGSYTFRANRGTTRTASAMQIVDGVLKGKSYTTGDPVTVTLYEDEDGNRVLKAHRADGLTWTVAKTEHALTKFLLADQVRPPAVKSPYKIAILPASGCFISDGSFGCGPVGEGETAQALARSINQDAAVFLAYSYYGKTQNEPSIGAADRFWTGEKPNLKAIYALGSEHNWDGIFMYRGDGDFVGGNTPATDVPVEFYLIDVPHRQVHTYKGMTNTVDEVARRALSTFLASAKLKVAATAQLPATRRWPPEQGIEGRKASITASSLKGWRATIGVFTDRDGCPDVPIDAQFFEQTEKTFDVPAGNKIDIVFKESRHYLLTPGEKYCMGAFRFSPKEGAQYNLRLASKIGVSVLGKSSCHYSFSVTDGDRENAVESYFPFKVIQGFGCTGLSCTEQSFKFKEFGPLIESICAK